MVDPELGHGGDEDEQAEQEFLGGLGVAVESAESRLLARKDQDGQTADKRGQDERAHKPPALDILEQFILGDGTTCLAASHALFHQAATLEKVPH